MRSMIDLSPTAIGTAGELRVASELLLRGFRPRLALLDDGIDIQLESGVTIQVKTGRKPRMQSLKPTYNFGFQTGVRGRPARNVQRMEADYAVCWCIPPDLFYVIPREAIGTRTVVHIQTEAVIPSRPGMFSHYLDKWEALR